MKAINTISIDLGEMRERVEALVASGAYTSVGDVLRAGLRALEREEAASEGPLREMVREALEDHRPSIPASQVFAELRALYQARLKGAGRADRVAFHPLARDDLVNFYKYICEQSGLKRAGDYLDRIEELCDSLADFSERGTPRADLGHGLRLLSLARRVLAVYRLWSDDVEILRIAYAGQQVTADDMPD